LTDDITNFFAEGGTLIEKEPSRAVLVPRRAPLICMVAPGIGLPLSSSTLPLICLLCAHSWPHKKTRLHNNKNFLMSFDFKNYYLIEHLMANNEKNLRKFL
jgi:hypothetical protein